MNIIIVGAGKVGSALTEQLSAEGHNITIVDSNPLAVNTTAERLDVMGVIGNGASMAILRQAGAEEAELLIAATSLDELNLLTCFTAKKLGVKHTIARIRNPEYTDQVNDLREELGLSMTVNPEQAAAQEAYQLLQFPSFLKREPFAQGRVEIVGVPVEKGSKLCGIPLSKLYEIAKVSVLVCAVQREDGIHVPSGTFTIQEGDTLFVTAGIGSLTTLVRNLGLEEKRVRSLLIIGGSRIALYLARRCLDSGMAVKIIERDHQRCLELAELLPQALIIEADGSRQDVLSSEGFDTYDAVITLTGMDEENLILSMLANRNGVGKVITKVDRMEYTDLFRQAGIGSIISPKGISRSLIARYVRGMSTASGMANMLALHTIVDGQVEALEFLATTATRHRGEKLMDIPLKPGILVSCITHAGRTTIPRGDSSFAAGDTVIVVTAGEHTISDINDIFAD